MSGNYNRSKTTRMVKANKENTLPQDRGWAWVIAAAGFLAHMVIGASSLANSILFVEIMKKYNASITTGSLMFMWTTLTYSVGSVVITNVILPKLGERRCVILGGLMSCAVSICASFAPDIGVFIAVIAVKGIVRTFIFIPALSLIPVYFKELRSRASMIPWCGACAANIVGPFIIRAISKEFGVSGTYFLLAALELNVCVAGLLLRPASAYRSLPDNVDTSLIENAESKSTEVASKDAKNDVQEGVHPRIQNNLQQQDSHTKNSNDVIESLLTSEQNADKMESAFDENLIPKKTDLTDVTMTKYAVVHSRERRNTFHGSVMTLDSEFGPPLEVMIQDVTDSPAEKGLTTKWHKLYQASALELWSFRWTLIAILPGTVNLYVTSYIPTISNSQGATLDQAALLVTIMGCVDLFSRIGIGFIVDTKYLSPAKLLVFSQMCMGLACHLFRLTSSFTSLIPMIIFIGLFVGSRGPVISLLCLDVVGAKKLPQAYGITNMLATLVGASFNPILGAVVEATGSFVFAMHVVGTSYMLCSVLIAFIPLFTRQDIKYGRKSIT